MPSKNDFSQAKEHFGRSAHDDSNEFIEKASFVNILG
jgi:hypothetical protein